MEFLSMRRGRVSVERPRMMGEHERDGSGVEVPEVQEVLDEAGVTLPSSSGGRGALRVGDKLRMNTD